MDLKRLVELNTSRSPWGITYKTLLPSSSRERKSEILEDYSSSSSGKLYSVLGEDSMKLSINLHNPFEE